MYKFGRPTRAKRPKKYYFYEITAIIAVIGTLVFAGYWFVVRKEAPTTIRNNNEPLVSRVEASDKFTEIEEPTFKLRLPGEWKEDFRDIDRYHSIKWDQITKGGVGRWLRVYVDTIPSDYPVTYMMPVSSAGNQIISEGISDNCVSFTPGAKKSSNPSSPSPGVVPSQWQSIDFLCDAPHELYQRAGTSSREGINTVTVTGPTKGTHKYFFVYDDANFNPDFTIFSTILDGFEAK